MALNARRSLVVLQAAMLAAMLLAPAVVHAAGEALTSTTIVSNLNPSLRGEAVTFTATVRLGDGVTPVTSGTVRFGRGASCGAGFTSLQGARAVDASGRVTFTNADIFFGTTTIWGCYDGVAGATLSSGASVAQAVLASLPTTLAVAPASGPFAGTTDLSATLTISGRSTAVGGVAVAFTLNGAAAGSATTNASGVAALPGVSLAGIASGSYPSGVGASFAGTTTRDASTGSAALTVRPAQVDKLETSTSVTCLPGPFTYTGDPVTPCSVTVTAADGLRLEPDPIYTTNVGAGTASASYHYPGDPTHLPSSDSASFEIAPATLLVDAVAASKTYGSHDPALSWAYRGFVGEEDAQAAGVSGSAACTRSAGETVLGGPYAITCLAGDLRAPNYRFETGAGADFTIDPAQPDCAVDGVDGRYDGTPYGATGACAGVLGEDLSAGLDLGPSFTDVPGGKAPWSYTDPAGNYAPAAGEVEVAITRASVEVAIRCPASVAYTGAAQTPCTARVNGAGSLDAPVEVTYANNVVGIATASASFPGDPNHEPGSASTTFAITYDWSGFLQPINGTGHQAGVGESRFRLGQTIPAKFVLLDARGNVITQATNPTFTRSANLGTCDPGAESESLPDVEPTGGNEFRWDGSQYHFNWSTRGLAPGEYRMYANLADGTHRSVDVCLTR